MRCFLCSRATLLPRIRGSSGRLKVSVTACWRHRNQGKIELQRRLAKGGKYTPRKMI